MLIALYSHGRRAGKDTANQFIKNWCEERHLSHQRLAFADKGKLLIGEALGLRSIGSLPIDDQSVIDRVNAFKLWGRLDIYMTSEDPGPGLFDSISGRDFIINLLGEGPGGGARKLFGNSFWTDQCLPSDWKPSADITVITDLRWTDEADRVHDLDGKVVEIVNHRAEHKGGRSEAGLGSESIDHQIHNMGSLDEYENTVTAMIDILWKQWRKRDPIRQIH